MKYECGVQKQFKCAFCEYDAKLKHHLEAHIFRRHVTQRKFADTKKMLK